MAGVEDHAQKCKEFNEWCAKVGIICPKLEFPAFFDGGLLGVKAIEPIRHREMIIAVPYSVLISTQKAWNDPVLRDVFSENERIFGTDESCAGAYPNTAHFVLCTFVMYELQKGKDSFWAPHLALMP